MSIPVNEEAPLFAIAVAAELAEMHPQTLRQYDRLGLVVPKRTAGKSRRYSLRDVMQLREVARLGAEGISLEGIRRILDLENLKPATCNARSRTRERAGRRAAQPPRPPRFAAGTEGGAVSLRSGSRTQRRTEVVVWRP